MVHPSRVLIQLLGIACAVLVAAGCLPDPGTPFDARVANDSGSRRVVYACLDDACIAGALLLQLSPGASGLVDGNQDYAVYYGVANSEHHRISCFHTMVGEHAKKVYQISAATTCPSASSDLVKFRNE